MKFTINSHENELNSSEWPSLIHLNGVMLVSPSLIITVDVKGRMGFAVGVLFLWLTIKEVQNPTYKKFNKNIPLAPN